MSEAEYIAVLWRVITGLSVVIAALIGVVWRHVVEDRKRAVDLQRVKDRLGINGAEQ